MPDFLLEPDEIEPDRHRPTRVVSSGLAPTAPVPTKRQGQDHAPCYAPCVRCGVAVLTGETGAGERLILDTTTPTYVALWGKETAMPRLVRSQGYGVHRCEGEAR